MVELTADRLVLVDDGDAMDYPGSIDDYIDFVLGRNQPKAAGGKPKAKKLTPRTRTTPRRSKRPPPTPRRQAPSSPPNARRSIASWPRWSAPQTITDLSRRRARSRRSNWRKAEAHWLEVSEQLEQLAA